MRVVILIITVFVSLLLLAVYAVLAREEFLLLWPHSSGVHIS